MDLHWTDGFAITVRLDGDTAVLSANREGLLSLAGILTALADGLPGDHVHLDRDNALEDDSAALIVEKIDRKTDW
ncbi:MAG: hypothetical protein II804_07015 [Clostridia bacterium]|nr:hypothetical protein [Clostridia bacterium]